MKRLPAATAAPTMAQFLAAALVTAEAAIVPNEEAVAVLDAVVLTAAAVSPIVVAAAPPVQTGSILVNVSSSYAGVEVVTPTDDSLMATDDLLMAIDDPLMVIDADQRPRRKIDQMADTTSAPKPRVGVAAVIKSLDGHFCIGRRKGSHGVGKWQFPGGHLEFGEDSLACARRETLEETGLRVRPLGIIAVTNDIFGQDNKHYITICVVCVREDEQQQPQCEGWRWERWSVIEELAKKGPDAADGLFLPIIHMIEQLQNPPWIDLDGCRE
ncbi:nudix domain containing protein [Grosmannia clavigera kw1407]|uniref:Nudix domain containing protein n=1 Tax=Grosmannia clavigera (strain kw1407 / UAMH 11150) TaxID=655863 RepID=F0XMP4_GROCL|nr:nudix domain containing protein [Grosmannia clavigera kw1407]EFX01086.1 nudix domain containing protein [Grosmannia clavigera kw1407]